jgi:Flp pilus assembly protein TadD
LSIKSLGALWQQTYKGLYVPLAYTILAVIALFARGPAQMMSSGGHTVTLNPGAFHVASVSFHIANTVLCWMLVSRLTRSRRAAMICSLVFAVHPLQAESVGWISELRGLSSGCFALAALNVLILSRQLSDRAPARSRALLAASAVFVACSMLCKPAAVVLPLAGLIVDRVALGTSWRMSIVTALLWSVCVLPFALITRSAQTLYPQGASILWQRPFVAGDALVFYLRKIVVPIGLCVEYGRTPNSVLSQGWTYAAWALPAGLLLFCFIRGRQRPIAWLGSLMFGTLLLPTLGLVPFSFQAHSTVADRYAYLPMIGIGLVIADAVTAARSRIATGAVSAVILVFAILSFNQSGYWVDNATFLSHVIDVNPNVAFAQINIGTSLLKQGRAEDALEHFSKALESDPTSAKAQNNAGLALAQLGRVDEAESHYLRAVELDPRYFKAHENLAALYLRTNRPDAAIASLKAAISIEPSEANALNDLGIAFMRSGRAAEGLDAFRRAVDVEPTNALYRRNLDNALSQMGRPY